MLGNKFICNCSVLIFICFAFATVCADSIPNSNPHVQPNPTGQPNPNSPQWAKGNAEVEQFDPKYKDVVTVENTEDLNSAKVKIDLDNWGKTDPLKLIIARTDNTKGFDVKLKITNTSCEDASGATIEFMSPKQCGLTYAFTEYDKFLATIKDKSNEESKDAVWNAPVEDTVFFHWESGKQSFIVGTGSAIEFTGVNCYSDFPTEGQPPLGTPFGLSIQTDMFGCGLIISLEPGYVFITSISPALWPTDETPTTQHPTTTASTTKPTTTSSTSAAHSTPMASTPEESTTSNTAATAKSDDGNELEDLLPLIIVGVILLVLIIILVIANIVIYLKKRSADKED